MKKLLLYNIKVNDNKNYYKKLHKYELGVIGVFLLLNNLFLSCILNKS